MDAKIVRAPGVPIPDDASAVFIESFDGARIRLVHYGGTGARGTALIIPGWAEPSEKYAEVALDLIDRGFKVAAMDPRGQGLSQRLDGDDTRGRIDDFEKHVGDLEAVVDHLQAERLTIVAHSMGGLITLAWLRRGGRADHIALCAPATQIFPTAVQRAGVRLLANFLCALGLGDLPLSKVGGDAMIFEGNPLTSDPERHDMLKQLLLADEDLMLPRTTPYFVRAMHREQQALHKDRAARDALWPLLFVSAGKDTIVDKRDHPRMASRLGCAEHVTLVDGALHEILMEQDQFRDQFWDAFDKRFGAVGS